MRAALYLSAALQAVLATANVFETAEGTISSDTRIEAFLKAHENDNPGAWPNMTTEADGIEARSTLATRAVGNAILANKCYYDIWVWSVDQNGSKSYKLPARSKKTGKFRQPCTNCGVSLKISRSNQLQAGRHTQFEYAIKSNILYFDISYVDCAQGSSAANCPGHESGHSIAAVEKSRCGSLYCKSGTYCPTQAYYVDKPLEKLGIPEPVKGCGGNGVGNDVYFKMCTDNKNLRKRVAGRVDYNEEEDDIADLQEVDDFEDFV